MKSRLPPLNALRAFEAAGRHASFKKAAAELHLTPAAISHQVKALEDYLGIRLFQRRNRALELTDAAKECLPTLTEGFDRLSQAIARMRAGEQTRTLEVRAAPTFAVKWLMPRLHRFIATRRDINVRISASTQSIDFLRREPAGDVEHNLPADDADLSIRFGTGDYPGFRVDKLFPVSITPMCSPRLLHGERALRHPDDLRHHALFHDDAMYLKGGESNWAAWLAAAGVAEVGAARAIRFGQTALALEAAADGAGVALAPPIVAAPDLASGRLVMPFALSLPSDFGYYAVSAEARRGRRAVGAFRDWLLEEAKAEESRAAV